VAVTLEGSEDQVWIRGAAPGGTPAAGARVLIAVRAEDIRLASSDGESSGSGLLPGTLSSRAYVGERWEYGVELAQDSLIVRCSEAGESSLSPGDAVGVEFSPDRVILLPDRPSAPAGSGHADDLSEDGLTTVAYPAPR
jgi:ABC-type Fe3+/spermidine/putrescine transport system ATPase subunit